MHFHREVFRRDALERGIGALLIIGALVLVTLGLMAQSQFRRLHDAADKAEHSQSNLARLDEILMALLDAETGQRGYLLTSQRSYLDPYFKGVAAARVGLDRVAAAAEGLPVQRRLNAQLRELANSKLAELAQTIDLHEHHQEAAALAIVNRNDGKNLMDAIRGVSAELIATERSELVQRRAVAEAAETSTTHLLWATATGLAVVFLGAFWLIRRELRARIAMTAELREQQQQLMGFQQRLEVLSLSDPLTGLPNRRQFDEKLAEALRRGQRQQQQIAVMFLDIDHFKTINDSLGHGAGDAVLREVGTRLKACVRDTDVVARLGGDEFVVLLEGLDVAGCAELIAQKIVESIRGGCFLGDKPVRVTTSVGVALSQKENGSATDLLKRADEALYDAKRAGRDGFRMAGLSAPDMHPQVSVLYEAVDGMNSSGWADGFIRTSG